jgi:hypothetical protein
MRRIYPKTPTVQQAMAEIDCFNATAQVQLLDFRRPWGGIISSSVSIVTNEI